MSWQHITYIPLLLIAAAVSVTLALCALQRRHVAGAVPFAVLMLGAAEWSLGYTVELGSADISAKVFWSNVNFVGIVVIPTAWLVFALQYAGHEKWLTRCNLALLAIEPLVTLLLAWTNEAHGLLRSNVRLDISGAVPMLAVTYGTGFWVYVAYSYLLIFFATLLLLRVFVRSPRLYRGQIAASLVSLLIPFVGNALHIYGWSPFPHLDLTPFSFTLSGLTLAWGFFRFRLFDLVPVARDAVIEGMDDGVMVLDMQNRIVDINLPAARIIGRSVSEIIGQPGDQVLSAWPGLVESYGDVTETRTEIVLDVDEVQHYYDLRISSLYDQRGRLAGRLFVSRNITDLKRAEELLQEEKETFFSILQKAPYGVLLIDQEERCLYVNPEFTDITGHALKDIPTMTDWLRYAFPDPEYRSEVIERWKEDTTRRTSRLYSVVCKERQVKEIEFRSTLLGDGRAILVLMDVTERRRAEKLLRENERFLQGVFDAIQDGISVLDRDLIVIHANQWMEKMYAALLPLVGKKCYEVYQQRQSPCPWCPSIPTFETGEAYTEIVPYPSAEKPTGWIELSAFPLKGVDGSVVSIIEHVKDITERKQAEEERERLLVQIREQVQRVQQIIDTVPEGVLLLDADDRIVLANPVAEGHLSLLTEAEIGDTLAHLGDHPLAELLTSPPKGLWHQVAADSRSFQVIARSIETGPTPGGWVLVTRDVTRQREIEQRIQQQERLAAVGQLAAGIAHDFNNIMATIVLYAQMAARSEGISTRDRERMEMIDEQAKHATQLVQQILDFSRRAVLERRPLDLLLLLKEQTRLLERTLPESIEIELDYGPDDYTVNADPTRMQQMMTNLAVNARDAMPEGGTLRFGLERVQIEQSEAPPLPEMTAGEWIQMTVSDTGLGIRSDDLPHIFEPFFTTKEPGRGSGLGLAQVHGIVGAHEGHIDVTSQVGQGATFTIYLPALPFRLPEAPTGVSLEALPALTKGEGETVLVVEDSASARRAVVESLELLGYRVLEAANGQEALAVLEERGEEIALVLSDVVMPGMGGMALLHALRERESTVPVVMLTGHPLEREMEDLQGQGMLKWLPKPPTLEQLAEIVAQALRED